MEKLEVKPANDLIPGIVPASVKNKGGRPRKDEVRFVHFDEELDPAKIKRLKRDVLMLIENRKANTPAKAAQLLKLSPSMVHKWIKADPKFAEAVRLSKEVVADWIEEDIINGEASVAKNTLLKGMRPEYRDNFNLNIRNPKLEELLTELRDIGQKQPEIKPTVEPALEDKAITPIGVPTNSNLKED